MSNHYPNPHARRPVPRLPQSQASDCLITGTAVRIIQLICEPWFPNGRLPF
ncbi:MAG: hypothetical protein KC476_05270 [Cyanobacteria bacterium HKST-UBA06]|nr:hypothetical protein [Cyanobacteria bacterium HKST-UBA06]